MARVIDGIRGHEEIWHRLMTPLRSGRLPHALAFYGPRGVGKKRMAWALAQALLCEGDEAPCGVCGPCLRVAGEQSEAVLALVPTGAAIKLEAAQQVNDFLGLRRLGRARVVLVENAQLMNAQTANALLKAIEEPPPGTYFILTTPEISQLLPTLRSRLQGVRFGPLSERLMSEILQEDLPAWMLRSARGSLEQLEQLGSEEDAELRARALALLKGAADGKREALDETLGQVKERELVARFARFLQQLLRDWSVQGTGDVIHSDLDGELQRLPPVAMNRRVELWRSAFQLETDVLAHVDRGLLLENFYYRARRAMS